MFGKFADAHVAGMDEPALDRYEALLDESDHDLLAWLTGRSPVPDRHDHDIFDLIRQFNVAGPLG